MHHEGVSEELPQEVLEEVPHERDRGDLGGARASERSGVKLEESDTKSY